MCGIAGFVKFTKNLNNNDLQKYGLDMSSALQTRGPDSFGVWADKKSGIVLSHRRLAVLDLSRNADQPMTSINKRFKIVYNGEIYNFLEIKREIQKSVNLRTSCDTEVILEAISLWGLSSTLKKLNGMFAFALWDNKEKKLFLARDRIGIKPLYWYHDKLTFAFSSELKAMSVLPWINFELDRESFASYVRFNYVPTPNCIFKNTYKLNPGSFLELSQNYKIKKSTFWSLQNFATKSAKKKLENQENLVELKLEKSIKNQMIADVPLGVFLSGGIDSTIVATLAQKNSLKKINTFTIGFSESSFDEATFARKVAKQIGTEHNEHYFSYSELPELLNDIGYIYDEPFSDSSQLPTLLLSQVTKKKVTVALSGDGGDELFGGYYRYFMAEKFKRLIFSKPMMFRKCIELLIRSIPKEIWNIIGNFIPKKYGGRNFGDKLNKLATVINHSDESAFYKRIVSNIDNISEYVCSAKEKDTIIWEKKLENIFPDLIERMQLIDTLTYLPDDILTKVDRASMNYSLEVRVPFLDNEVVEKAWELPLSKKINRGHGKIILKNILSNHMPKNLFERPKMGFGIPLDKILRTTLKPKVEYYLFSEELKYQNLFNLNLYRIRWKEHLNEDRNWQFLIWNFLVFQIWYERWIK